MLTFRDLIGKKTTVYSVSRNGSMAKWDNVLVYLFRDSKDKSHTVLRNGPLMEIDNLDSNKAGITKGGNISISWSNGVFLDINDAAALAEKIATTKYRNSMKRIKKMLSDAKLANSIL